jgi:hypothetical protein
MVPSGGIEPLSSLATVLQTADPPRDLVRRDNFPEWENKQY